MKSRAALIALVSSLFIFSYFYLDNWKTTMENGDSSGYYFHVVSLFINQDVGDYSKTIDKFLEYYPNAGDPRKDVYGVRLTPKGKYYIKYTLGVGVMEVPAFLLAHGMAKITGWYEADGWSKPYIFWVNFSKVIYILIGAFFLIGVLEKFFSKPVVAATVIALLFATNLYYHGIFLTLSHSYLFFDFSVLIYLTIRFYENPRKRSAFFIGALVGLIALTRVPEVVSLFVPLLWGVTSVKSFLDRVQFFIKNYAYLLIASLGLLLVFSPQLIYWYYTSGKLFFNPYQGETFNFLNPQIFKGWFNFKNGWLVYTPIMVFGLIGLVNLAKKYPGAILSIISFIGLNSWIHYSYYVWNYFPGMGSRPMIETYPLLSFGLAAFFEFTFKGTISRLLTSIAILFFIWLNVFQSFQMRKGIIWTERGNFPFYWETFGTMTSTPSSLISYDTRRFHPQKTALQLLDTLYFNDFERKETVYKNGDVFFSGKYSILNTTDKIHSIREFPFNIYPFQPGDWAYFEVKAYRNSPDMVWNRDNLENLVLEVQDGEGKTKFASSIKIASHIDNKDYSIWHCGTPNVWGTAGFFIKVPKSANSTWKLKAYIWNEHLLRLYLDDFTVLHYRPKQ